MVSDSGNFFRGVPGPTPWYSRPDDLAIEGFRWQQTSNKFPTRSKTLLVGDAGVVAILDFYNYVMRLDTSTLLIWNQQSATSFQGSPPVHLVVVRPGELPPFGDNLEAEASRMEAMGTRLALPASPVATMNLNTGVSGTRISAVFPRELEAIDELLILCSSSAVTRHSGTNAGLALLVAKPTQSSFQLYPQDWFNSADLDFGYQWVTRVARDPQTGRVRGEGIRIDPFELDDTLQSVVKVAGG